MGPLTGSGRVWLWAKQEGTNLLTQWGSRAGAGVHFLQEEQAPVWVTGLAGQRTGNNQH